MGNADETPVFFDMPANTTVDTKGSKSVLVKTTGMKNRITVMISVQADGRKLTPFVILRRKNLPKEKLPTGIIFKCNEKGWKMEELIAERSLAQKTKCSSGFRCFQGPLNRERENCSF
jgi:hypothetical protein